MTSTVERLEDGTIELRVKLPWSLIEKEREVVVEELAKSLDLPGFRKGKAPKKLVSEKLDQARIREEILRKLLPQAYIDAVKEHSLKPIMDPRIHVEGELVDGQEWEFHAITCEAPVITLGAYKDEIKKITAKSKIVVPGKETEDPKFEEIIKALLDSVEVKIPGALIEREADRLISQTLDEIKKLGMTLDQYLTSTGRTAEDLRAEYAKKAESDIKLEFALQKVAEEEKITVEDQEVQKTIDQAKPEEREGLEQNRYLLASIIRQQKTLDLLKSL